MEFQYYFDNSPIDPLILELLWSYDSSSTTGDLTTLLDETTPIDMTDKEDFTIFVTLYQTTARACVLFSNWSEDTDKGWCLGIDSGNFLYLDCISPNNTSFRFDQINLGNKNCLVIRKSGKIFSVFKYDLLSQTFESKQSVSFTNEENLEAETQSLRPFPRNSSYYSNVGSYIDYFVGKVEQMAVLSAALDDSYILYLLQGFLPYSNTVLITTTATKVSEVYRFPSGSTDYAFLDEYINSFDTSIASSLTGGGYIGYSTGTFNSSYFFASGIFSTGVTQCYGVGAALALSKTGATIFPSSSATGYFTDSIKISSYSGITAISHNITLSGGIYGSGFHLDDDAIYDVSYSGSSTSFVINESYYTGFKMDGVVSLYSKYLILATNTGVDPSGVNLVGQFDNVEGKFHLPNFNYGNSNVFFDGWKASGNQYTHNSGIIDIIGENEDGNNYVYYDNAANITFLYLGLNNYATGQFYPNSAIVYTGINSYSTNLRTVKPNYKETSSIHLYHGKSIQSAPTGVFDDNTGLFWF